MKISALLRKRGSILEFSNKAIEIKSRSTAKVLYIALGIPSRNNLKAFGRKGKRLNSLRKCLCSRYKVRKTKTGEIVQSCLCINTSCISKPGNPNTSERYAVSEMKQVL